MATINAQRPCPTCEQVMMFQKRGTNHLLHFLVTILTGGLWLFAWVAVGLMRLGAPWRCSKCGSAPTTPQHLAKLKRARDQNAAAGQAAQMAMMAQMMQQMQAKAAASGQPSLPTGSNGAQS